MLMPAGEVCPTVVPAPLGLGDDINSNGVCCACYRSASHANIVLLFTDERPLASCCLSVLLLSCPAPTCCLSYKQAHVVRSPIVLMHYCVAAGSKRLWHGIALWYAQMAWNRQLSSLLREP